MPYKRKDSDVWWISYTAPDGKRARRSSGTTSYEAAKALEQQIKANGWKEKEWGVAAPKTFEEVVIKYLEHASITQRSYQTTCHRIKALRKHLAGRVLHEMGGTDIREYNSQRLAEGASTATINRELSALSAAINYCNRELEWNIPNPVSDRKLREPEGRVRWLNRGEAEALCRAASTQRFGLALECFIRLAVNTGCRKEEMLGLEWRRVDFSNGLIHLEGKHTKAGKRRSIPINAGATAALKRLLAFRAKHAPGSQWVFIRANGERIKCIRNGFDTACEKAGIDDFTIHDLRHTCAAWLVSAGVPLAEVRDLLGHSTVMMTERYAHLAPARVRKAVEVLDQPCDSSTSRFGHGAISEGENVTPLRAVTD